MEASSPDVQVFEETWAGITLLPGYLLTVCRATELFRWLAMWRSPQFVAEIRSCPRLAFSLRACLALVFVFFSGSAENILRLNMSQSCRLCRRSQFAGGKHSKLQANHTKTIIIYKWCHIASNLTSSSLSSHSFSLEVSMLFIFACHLMKYQNIVKMPIKPYCCINVTNNHSVFKILVFVTQCSDFSLKLKNEWVMAD